MEYKVERARKEDAFALFNLAYACLKEAGFSPLSGGLGKEVNPSAAERACREGRVRVIRQGEELAAAITLTGRGAEDLFAAPEYRGECEKILLKAAEDELAARGAEEMTLRTHIPSPLYLECGYRLVRRKRVMDGGRAVSVTEERKKRLAPYAEEGGCAVIIRHASGQYLLMKRAKGRICAGKYECSLSGDRREGEGEEECAARLLYEYAGLKGELKKLGEQDKTAVYLHETSRARGDIVLNAGYSVFKWAKRESVLRSKTPLLRKIREYLLVKKRRAGAEKYSSAK